MRFLLDENFPRRACALLQSLGHEVLDVRGTEREGGSDQSLFQFAQDQQAVLLTTDRDFYHTIPHLFVSHHGAVIITLSRPSGAALMAKLEQVLPHIRADGLRNTIILATDRRIVALTTHPDHSP